MLNVACPPTDAHQKRLIWAVGGGKGGTGKSFVSANLGLGLSAQLDLTLIDADLGCPNLHTFLGIKNRELTLADFLYRQLQLEQVASDTGHGKLRLISGSNETPGVGDLEDFRKKRLFRQIQELNSTVTLLDLGAGTSFNCLDLFILADTGILIVNPEPASIENAYQFIRAVTLRLLETAIRKCRMPGLLERVIESRSQVKRSIYGLLELVEKEDPTTANMLMDELEQFRPCLIVNKVRRDDDVVLGRSIADVVTKFLAVKLNFVGGIPFDEEVEDSLRRFDPYVTKNPHSRAACALKLISERLVTTSRARRRFIPLVDLPYEEGGRAQLLRTS